MKGTLSQAAGQNRLRIIGGRWRGRRLCFPAVPGLRPTPDRVRETLFNWLQPVIEGAHCLDLFAGSGALGLEALSRGAAEVLFVDRDPRVIEMLRGHLLALEAADRGAAVAEDGLAFLRRPASQRFDIVFLDPPFRQGLAPECCRLLDVGWLAPQARVYIEMEAQAGPPPLPEGWRLARSKQAGQVGYHLAFST